MNELYSSTSNAPCIPMRDINPEPCEVRESGIYNVVRDTSNVLYEIMEMLACFGNEVSNDTCRQEKITPTEPRTFKENVHLNNEIVYAIRNDLKKIMSEFR